MQLNSNHIEHCIGEMMIGFSSIMSEGNKNI